MKELDPTKLNPSIWNYIPLTDLSVYTDYGFDENGMPWESRGPFETFIERKKLQIWSDELELYRAYLRKSFGEIEAQHDFYDFGRAPIISEESELAKAIREVGNNKGLSKIVLYGNGEVVITDPAVLLQLSALLNKFCENSAVTTTAPPIYPRKASVIKSYIEKELFPFYNFLFTEVYAGSSTKSEIYGIIDDFVKTYGFDLIIASTNGPGYLADTFKKL